MRASGRMKDRYLQDNWRVRLGGLASNLGRLADFAGNPTHRKLVDTLLEESEHFIEWTVPDAPIEMQARLVELQIQLALWRRRLPETAFLQEAKKGSTEVLEMSGMLSDSPA